MHYSSSFKSVWIYLFCCTSVTYFLFISLPAFWSRTSMNALSQHNPGPDLVPAARPLQAPMAPSGTVAQLAAAMTGLEGLSPRAATWHPTSRKISRYTRPRSSSHRALPDPRKTTFCWNSSPQKMAGSRSSWPTVPSSLRAEARSRPLWPVMRANTGGAGIVVEVALAAGVWKIWTCWRPKVMRILAWVKNEDAVTYIDMFKDNYRIANDNNTTRAIIIL